MFHLWIKDFQLKDVHHLFVSTPKEKKEEEAEESESKFDLWPEGFKMLDLETLLLTARSTLLHTSMIKIHYFTF